MAALLLAGRVRGKAERGGVSLFEDMQDPFDALGL
jgi:hypothetical protein